MDIISINTIAYFIMAAVACAFVSRISKLPLRLLLVFSGIVLTYITFKDKPLFSLSDNFVHFVVAFSLPLLFFDVFSRLKKNHKDSIHTHALHSSLLLLFMSLVFIGLTSYLLFPEIPSLFVAGILGLILAASSQFDVDFSVPYLYRRFLQEESIISNAFMIVSVFSIIALITSTLFDGVLSILTGIGVGVVAGIIMFRLIHFNPFGKYGTLALVFLVIVTYLIAGLVDGSGAFAAVSLGLFFGGLTIKKRDLLGEFSRTYMTIAEMAVFILIGFLFEMPLNLSFFLSAVMLFLFFILIRFMVFNIFLYHDYSLREKLFMSLCTSKGSMVAIVILSLFVVAKDYFATLFPVALAIIILSMIVSFFASKYESKIVGKA